MEDEFIGTRARLLDPIDRISEILFGLIMAVTIVGSLSIASAGENEVRTVLWAALGCNMAWGLVDAVMYLVRTLTERTRNVALAHRLRASDPETANRLITAALPEHVVAITGPGEIEGMRQRLLALPAIHRAGLARGDYLAATGIFLLVVGATFPVVIPFMIAQDVGVAMQISRVVTLAMLFLAGLALGRHSGHAHPVRIGLTMALVGVVLIAIVIALGG